LWTSEQSRRGVAWPELAIRSRPLLVRLIVSPASVKTPSICLSSSSRSVMISHAGVGVVLQDPLGQQHHDDALAAALGVPDDAALAARTCSCAALMPKYWCTRGSFLMPPSNSTKSCISSISRSLRTS
jgi:hypothetical protein